MTDVAATRRRVSRLLLAAGWLGLLAGSASAQPLPWRAEERVPPGWTFTPGVSFGAAWDSSINTGNHPVFEALFQKYVGRVNPHAKLDFVGRHTTFKAGYSGSIDKYWGSTATYEQHSQVSLNRVVTSRFSTSADLGYSAAPTTDRLLTGDAVPPPDATLPFVTIDASYLTTNASFAYQTSPRTTLSGSYGYQQVTLDDESLEGELALLRDGSSHGPTLAAMRAFTPRLSIGAAAEYRREVIGSDSRYDIQTAAAVFSYRATRTTTITAGGGPSRVVVLDAEDDTTVAPAFYGGFTHAQRRMQISGSYSRSFVPLYGFGTLTTNHSVTGGVSAPLLDREYYFSAIVVYSRSTEVEALGLGLDLNTLWSTAAVGRRLTTWLDAQGYVSVSHQTWDERGSTSQTRVGVQFVTVAPVRMQ